MTEIKPRFEFRTFGQGFGPVVHKMRRLSPLGGIRESHETYIMSKGNNENNTKIRDGKMDIKVFVTEREGLEQWNPRMKGRFPMPAATLRDEVFEAFGVEAPEMERGEYTLEQFLGEIVAPHGELLAVDLLKRRFAFTVGEVIAEWAKVLVNGALIETVCLESVDVEKILEAMKMVGVEDCENVNYLLGIKRVVGMEPLPADFQPMML